MVAAEEFKRSDMERHTSNSNGYLVCSNCRGYYQLKDGEYPEDFESCECGGPLEYHSSLQHEHLPKISKEDLGDDESLDKGFEDYSEIEQLLTALKSKSEKRKNMIINLSNRIHIQEDLLNELKEDRWTIWDQLNEKNLYSDIRDQKDLLEEIAQEEDRFMSIVKQQRLRAHKSEASILSYYMKKIGAKGLLVIESVIIVVLLILFFAKVF